MAQEEFDSIQEVLRRRRGAAFVGRDGQLALFRENHGLPPDRRAYVFNVHGEGGVGKSTLLERWRQIARELSVAEAMIDEHVFGVPEGMSAIVEQLDTGGATKDFRRRYADFRRSRERLESDPQAPRELWRQVIRTGVKVGLHASKALPGVAPVVDLVDGDTAADAVDRVREFLVGKVRDSREVRLLLSPTRELSPGFVAALSRIAARRPVCLFFDTFEQTGAFLSDWLRDLLLGEYGALSTNVTIVVAGRLPLDPNGWSELLGLVAPVPLNPFTDAEARQLLAAQGVTDPRAVETILALSGGLPLLIDMLAKSRPADTDEIGDPTDTAVERFLKWEPDETRRRVALAGALPRGLDEDLLRAAAGADSAADLFGWLTGQAFVRLHAGRYRYHSVVRAPMLRRQRQRSPEQWAEGHARLADTYRSRRDLASTERAWTDAVWLDHHVEMTYHDLIARKLRLPAALHDAVTAAAEGIAVARRWSELILEAGRDADDDAMRTLGESLVAAATTVDSDGTAFLTTLIESGRPDAEGMAAALAERAWIHFLADREPDAIDDCDRAVDLRPGLAQAYGLRGAAKFYLGRHQPALADMDEAIRLKSDYVWAIVYRGRIYRELERPDEALADFDRAVALDPTDSWAFAHRGDMHRALGHDPEALADYQRSVQLDPDAAWVRSARGDLLRHLGRFDEALADLDRAVELDPDDAASHAYRGETYRAMGRYDDALAELSRAIELAPEYEWALASRGALYRSLKRYAESLADLDRAIELDPGYGWAISGRGETYRLMERYDEAMADFDRAAALGANTAWDVGSRGQALLGLRRYDEALAEFDRAIRMDPALEWAIADRAETHWSLRHYDEAIADLDRVIAMDPADAEYLVARGVVRRDRGDEAEAAADFRRATEVEPGLEWTVEDGNIDFRRP